MKDMLLNRFNNLVKENNNFRDVTILIMQIVYSKSMHKSIVIDLCRDRFPKVSRKQVHLLIEWLISKEIMFKKSDLYDMRKKYLFWNDILNIKTVIKLYKK